MQSVPVMDGLLGSRVVENHMLRQGVLAAVYQDRNGYLSGLILLDAIPGEAQRFVTKDFDVIRKLPDGVVKPVEAETSKGTYHEPETGNWYWLESSASRVDEKHRIKLYHEVRVYLYLQTGGRELRQTLVWEKGFGEGADWFGGFPASSFATSHEAIHLARRNGGITGRTPCPINREMLK